MNVPSRINVENIKINGISSSRTLIDTVNTNRIHTFVSLLNDREPVSEKVERWAEQGETVYYGRRCQDAEVITERITSAIAEYALTFFSNEQLAEMWVNAQVSHFTGRELAILTNNSIKECASADHWYTFEKEW